MKRLIFCLIAALALLAQSGGNKEIPPCEGAECNGGHEGQPKFCQNSDHDGYKANCQCKRDCKDRNQDQHRETGCKTFCRTKSCHCDHGCGT